MGAGRPGLRGADHFVRSMARNDNRHGRARPNGHGWSVPSRARCDGKTYRSGACGKPATKANDDISIGLEGGQVFGLLGHNGAGKTTLINQVVGLLKPDAGTIRHDGHDLVADPGFARRSCSLQAQAQVPIDGLTPHQAIELIGRMRGGSPSSIAAGRSSRARQLSSRRRSPTSYACRSCLNLAASAPPPPAFITRSVPDGNRAVDDRALPGPGRLMPGRLRHPLLGIEPTRLKLIAAGRERPRNGCNLPRAHRKAVGPSGAPGPNGTGASCP
jgi:energy-coupling factor transporter ATP-binding protein EcfA2